MKFYPLDSQELNNCTEKLCKLLSGCSQSESEAGKLLYLAIHLEMGMRRYVFWSPTHIVHSPSHMVELTEAFVSILKWGTTRCQFSHDKSTTGWRSHVFLWFFLGFFVCFFWVFFFFFFFGGGGGGSLGLFCFSGQETACWRRPGIFAGVQYRWFPLPTSDPSLVEAVDGRPLPQMQPVFGWARSCAPL